MHYMSPGLPPVLLQCSFLPLLFPYLNPWPTSVHDASLRQELRQGHRHPRSTTQPDRLCSQSFFCLCQLQTKALRKLERSPKAKKLTTRQVQPSQASMSTALVTPFAPNHTLSVGTMTECLFFFYKLSCQCFPHDNAPPGQKGGGSVIMCPELGIFHRHKLPNFSKPCAFPSLPVFRLSVYKVSLVPLNLCDLKL
ncbi:hypothetical protein BDP81DRAFT_214936 [Colletotrichum phormii]|uniref:Secreted protein n=1 Tax=Colletotrichum phormii TaxID=359342 RepID=A0AAJ0EIA4_9PEZI|nr:uncharacterized protein BDP81DRAFT_214936 [Colletotrichum phormii]KAK1637886.1 hypothetical protein BDP81DRAFT_214936 [Colletotrichum phormii]